MTVPSLTGVRGAAALWVLLFHVQSFANGYGAPWLKSVPLLAEGWVGVDLFFVLSGFILMFVHEADFEQLRGRAVLHFAALRFFRIYPLATAVLILIALLVFADPGFAPWYRQSHDPADLTGMAFLRTLLLATRWYPPFVGDWNQPVWSLSVEIIGYCALPFLAFATTRVSSRPVLVALAAVCLVAPVALQPVVGSRVDNDIFGFAIIRMAGAFTGGVMLCRLHRLTPAGFGRWQGAIGDVALVVLVVTLLTPLKTWAATPCFGALIYGIASGRGAADWLFGRPVSLFFGRISFPLYLIHAMVLIWGYYELGAHGAGWPLTGVALGLYIPGIILAAWGLHLAVERPSQRLGRAVARRLEPAAGSASPRSGGNARKPASPG